MNTFHKIIKDICLEENIEFKTLSKDWIIKLEKNNKTRFINGYKFDINNHGIGLIFDDKYSTYEVLKSFNIPIIEHRIVYSNDNNNEYARELNTYQYLEDLYNKFNRDIVVKINNGSCGTGVLHITNKDELKQIYNEFSSKYSSFSVCPFYEIENEYRVIVLDNEIKLMYKKIKPVIYGNDINTIKELLMDFNYDYFKNYNEDNKNDILALNEKFEYNWQFNLSKGSISSLEIDDEIKNKISNIISKITNNIDFKFGSIDIIKTIYDEFYVLEINSGVMMDNFIKQNKEGNVIAKEIYKQAIKKMFE